MEPSSGEREVDLLLVGERSNERSKDHARQIAREEQNRDITLREAVGFVESIDVGSLYPIRPCEEEEGGFRKRSSGTSSIDPQRKNEEEQRKKGGRSSVPAARR